MLCILFKAEEASHGEFYIHKDNYTQQNTLTRIHLIEIDKSRKDLTIKETEYVMEEWRGWGEEGRKEDRKEEETKK
jgi:hypothetical protein